MVNEFEQTIMDILHQYGNKLDIQTDNQGQLIIYTGMAQLPNGELVIFDSNAPEGTYMVSV